jgi:hypothetical protein
LKELEAKIDKKQEQLDKISVDIDKAVQVEHKKK